MKYTYDNYMEPYNKALENKDYGLALNILNCAISEKLKEKDLFFLTRDISDLQWSKANIYSIKGDLINVLHYYISHQIYILCSDFYRGNGFANSSFRNKNWTTYCDFYKETLISLNILEKEEEIFSKVSRVVPALLNIPEYIINKEVSLKSKSMEDYKKAREFSEKFKEEPFTIPNEIDNWIEKYLKELLKKPNRLRSLFNKIKS